jgi:hypothetical protein
MKRTIVLLLALTLTACVSTPSKIVATPTQGALPIPIHNPTIITDLQSATFNLDQAVAIGALPKDDPAPACLHDFLVKAGIEVPAGAAPQASFTPKNDGIASVGSIVYIQAQQAKAISALGAPAVAVSCKALLGQFVIDGATAVVKGVKDMPLIRFLPPL